MTDVTQARVGRGSAVADLGVRLHLRPRVHPLRRRGGVGGLGALRRGGRQRHVVCDRRLVQGSQRPSGTPLLGASRQVVVGRIEYFFSSL